MAINWYPGHMHKAHKLILDSLQSIDVLIEIVDARLPYSSQNPLIGKWRESKPTIVILSKTDLADAEHTAQWQAYLENRETIKTLAYHREDQSKLKQIAGLCQKLTPDKTTDFQPVQAMIVGIPNVGKSTLINALVGKAIAKVGDEPAITKRQQKITLNERVTLRDTPGILWPKIENPHSGYRLAMIGSIKNTAIDFEDIGLYAAETLLQQYPERLQSRYELNAIPESAIDCLEAIGAKRGAKQRGGRVDLHKTSELLLHDLRNGHLGAVTLETPAMIERELLDVETEKARKAALKQAKRKSG